MHPSPSQFHFIRRGILVPLRECRIGEASHPGSTRTNSTSSVIGSNDHATNQRARTLQALNSCGLVREPLPHAEQTHSRSETTASGSAGPCRHGAAPSQGVRRERASPVLARQGLRCRKRARPLGRVSTGQRRERHDGVRFPCSHSGDLA